MTMTREPPTVDRMPPVDVNAEAGTIGSIIVEPSTLDNIAMFVKSPDYFSQEDKQTLYQAILDLNAKGSGIDAMLLVSHLKTTGKLEQAGGLEHIREVANAVGTSLHAEYYAAIVAEKYNRRRLISECDAVRRDCYESSDGYTDLFERAEQRFFALTEQRITGEAVHIADVVHEALEDIYNPQPNTTARTGMIELDNLTGGMRQGQMVVLAARPSHGKTALAWSITENLAMNEKMPVGFFSLEMSRKELTERALCSRAMVNSKKLRANALDTRERERLNQAVGDVCNGMIFIDDTPGITAMEFRAKARKLVRKHGIKFIVLDYLQLMEGAGSNRQEQVSSISRLIKATARELCVPVLALSQLNRSSETEGRLPRPSDLRESGTIEQDADAVWLLYRESVAQRGNEEWFQENAHKVNDALLIVAKQRNGECGTVKMTYLAGQTRFVNYSPGLG